MRKLTAFLVIIIFILPLLTNISAILMSEQGDAITQAHPLNTQDNSLTILNPENRSYLVPIQGYYFASEGFDAAADGALPGNWNYSGSGAGYNASIIANKTDGSGNDHKKVLYGHDAASGRELFVSQVFNESQTSGTCDLWVLYVDFSSNLEWNFGLKDSLAQWTVLIAQDQGNFWYYNGTVKNDTGIGFTEDKWYRVSLDFSDDGTYAGLAAHQYRLRIYDSDGSSLLYTSPDVNFYQNGSSTQFSIFTGDTTSPDVYVDAIGYSWDPFYNIGDNGNESFPLSFTSSVQLDWIAYSLDGQSNVTIPGNTTIPIPQIGSHGIQVFGNDSIGTPHQSPIQYFRLTNPLGIPALDAIVPSVDTEGAIELNWSAVVNATTYYLYRHTSFITSVSGLSPVATTSATSYNDTILSSGTYYYAVVAGNLDVTGAPSNCESVTVDVPTNPLPYTSTGGTYNVTESFDEVVSYGGTQADLKYGNNVSIGLDSGYPSYNASKVRGTVTSLVENRTGAFDNDFSTGLQNWSGYIYGPMIGVGHQGGTQCARISMQGQINNLNNNFVDDTGYDGNMDGGGGYWDVSDTGRGDQCYSGYSGGTIYFYHYERSPGRDCNHDVWCDYETCYTTHSNGNIFMARQLGLKHGVHTEPGGGGEITSATLSLRYKADDNMGDSRSSAQLRVTVRFSSYDLWDGSGDQGWTIVDLDVTSVLQNIGADTAFDINFYLSTYLYANNGDSESVSVTLDYAYLYINYKEARKFDPDHTGGFQSDLYTYGKDTQTASFSFAYKFSTNWVTTWAQNRGYIHLYMSDVAGGGSSWIWNQQVGSLTIDDNWHTQTIDLTSELGQNGALDQFYFRLFIDWGGIWGDPWGPLTSEALIAEFDNITFDFVAEVEPEEVQLHLRDPTIGGPDIPVNTTGFGTGIFDSGPTHSWVGNLYAGTPPNLEWVIKNPDYGGPKVEITVSHGTIFMREWNVTTANTYFSCEANATNTWYLELTTCSKPVEGRISAGSVEIGVPDDWGAQYTTVNPTSSGEIASRPVPGTLKIVNTQSNTHYTFTASSPNKLYEQIAHIRNQENSTGIFSDNLIGHPTNFTRLRVNASDDDGYLKMKLYHSPRNGPEFSNGYGIEIQENFPVGTNETYSTPYQLPIDAIPGEWMYVLTWNNSLTSDQLSEVGYVVFPGLEMRRQNILGATIFGKKLAGVVDLGNSSKNAANRTLDMDPLSINVSLTDFHLGTPFIYYNKAYINITADYGVPDPNPYDDLPPYTTIQKNLTRDGNHFFYEISQADYATWCYTGLHNFTIVLESDYIEFNGSVQSVFLISGSFFVITNINLTIDPSSTLTDPPSFFLQGSLMHFRIQLFDISHNIIVDNISDYVGLMENPWQGAVHPEWSLVFPQQYFNFSKGGYPGTNGTFFSTGTLGTYDAYFTLHPLCEPVNSLNSFPMDYYYFNITVDIAKNDGLNWEAEMMFCKNNTPSPDPEPYRKPDWGLIEVGDGPSITIEYPSLGQVFSNSSIVINGTARGGGQNIDVVSINDSRFNLTTNPEGNATGIYEFQNISKISEGLNSVEITVNSTVGLVNTLIWWFYLDNTIPTIAITNPAFNGAFYSNSIINISGIVNGTGSEIASVEINDSRFTLATESTMTLFNTFWFQNITNIPDGNLSVAINVTDSAGFSATATRWFTIDNTLPSITLDDPQNQTIVVKPTFLNLTVWDQNLIPGSVEWRADVNQTSWTTDFIGTYDINLSEFTSNQAVQFWVRANDTAGNSAEITLIFTFDNDIPTITLNSPQNGTILQKPSVINLTITDQNLDVNTVEWKANVTQINWTNSFLGTYYIDLFSFASDQTVQFWVRANDTAGNSAEITIILTFDDTTPQIYLAFPENESLVPKPEVIVLSIIEDNLELNSLEWKANVTQTSWTNTFEDFGIINIVSFGSNQGVQFWVRANDSAGHSTMITFLVTFDDIPPAPLTNPIYDTRPGNITLRWTGPDELIYYQIWRNGVYLENVTTMYYSDTQYLEPGDYEYIIIPVDEAGNVGESLTFNIRVLRDLSMVGMAILIGILSATFSAIIASVFLTRRYKKIRWREKFQPKPTRKKKSPKQILSENRTALYGMILTHKELDLEQVSQLIGGTTKEDIKALIYDLIGDKKVQGTFKGNIFKIQSDPEEFIKNLDFKLTKWETLGYPARAQNIYPIIRSQKSLDLNEASKIIEGTTKEGLEKILYELIGEQKVIGAFEGEIFKIQSDIEQFILQFEVKLEKLITQTSMVEKTGTVKKGISRYS